jgi:hypothetical protein
MPQKKSVALTKMVPAFAGVADLPAAFQLLQTKFNAVLAKLDADAGVTDTNYAALHGVTTLDDS